MKIGGAFFPFEATIPRSMMEAGCFVLNTGSPELPRSTILLSFGGLQDWLTVKLFLLEEKNQTFR
jgi:hypothetical protein